MKFWLPDPASSSSNVTPAQVSNVNHGPWRYYLVGLALYLFALWSKTATVALPAVILLLLWWKCGKIERRNIYLLLPFLIIGFVMGMITMWVEKNHVGAAGQEWNFSLVERCLITGRMFWFYLGKLLWPYPLMFIYPRWEIHASQPAAYLPVLAAGIGLLILWQNRNGWGRPALCAAGCFIATLFPVLGFFNVFFFRFSFVCDHFQYLASIGPLALAAAGITVAFVPFREGKPFMEPVFGAMLLLVLGGLTWRQAAVYRNSETLWRDTLAKNRIPGLRTIISAPVCLKPGGWTKRWITSANPSSLIRTELWPTTTTAWHCDNAEGWMMQSWRRVRRSRWRRIWSSPTSTW